MPYSLLISPGDLYLHLNDPDWIILDCRFSLADPARGRKAYQQAHIPGAQYVHLDEDLSGPIIPGQTGRHPLPTVEAFSERLGRWGIDETVQVVAYDDLGGAIAARLWWMLQWLGHEAVAVLDGGFFGWHKADFAVKRGDETRPPRTFTPHPRPGMVADATAVEQARQEGAACLLDARAAERYAGFQEPIDPVAGHIPGARSAPFRENLDDDNTFLPPDQLRARFRYLLGDTPPTSTISYCGSGVTGAHNLLAMAVAGLPGARLYPGSWSEWITDPARPIATGEQPAGS